MVNHSHPAGSNVQMLEAVSALVDGEASELELRRILNATDSDPNLRATWARYQCVSALMRGDEGIDLKMDLSAAVREAIDEEPAVQAALTGRSGWRLHLPRVGIAASVAAVMVLTAQVVSMGGGDSVQPQVAGAATNTVTPTVGLSSEEKLLQNAQPRALPAGFPSPSLTARTVSSAPAGLAYGGPALQSVSRPVIVTTPVQPPEEVQLYLQQLMELHAANRAAGEPVYIRVPVSNE